MQTTEQKVNDVPFYKVLFFLYWKKKQKRRNNICIGLKIWNINYSRIDVHVVYTSASTLKPDPHQPVGGKTMELITWSDDSVTVIIQSKVNACASDAIKDAYHLIYLNDPCGVVQRKIEQII